jgi:hypothetical protein
VGTRGSMDPTSTAGTGGSTAATPLRVFLSHTSDLGRPDEAGRSWGAAVAAVLRMAPAGRSGPFGHAER